MAENEIFCYFTCLNTERSQIDAALHRFHFVISILQSKMPTKSCGRNNGIQIMFLHHHYMFSPCIFNILCGPLKTTPEHVNFIFNRDT